MHIQCWIWFSVSIFIYVSFFLAISLGVLQESGLHTVQKYINCLLTCSALIMDCSWIIPLTWSQQNTVAKVVEVIVISHILTRAKDAFVWNNYYFIFSLRKHKLPNINCNKILCVWELVDYLCGDMEYNIHSTLLERSSELATKKATGEFQWQTGAWIWKWHLLLHHHSLSILFEIRSDNLDYTLITVSIQYTENSA